MVFAALPKGGKALAVAMATISGKGYLFPEKKTIALKTENSREVTEVVFDRHSLQCGEVWWIVEDVCNNFSTTERLINLIAAEGKARVGGIVCFLNRSLAVDENFDGLPVISLVRKPIDEYRQDDPAVRDDIARGNVVWKPKGEWHKLEEAMAEHSMISE